MTSPRRHLVALAVLAFAGVAACSHREAAPSSASGFDTSPRAAHAYRLRINAEQAHTERRYADCARLYVELDGLDTPDRDDDELSAAACLARTGDLDGALAHLRTATEHGYRNTSQLRTLEDLAPLRDAPAWHDLVERTNRNREHYLTGANRELYALYAADQADRTGVRYEDVDWAAVSGRDGDRRTRVLELMRDGAAHVAADYLHAAMALQHGTGPDDYQLANQWATEAVRLAPSDPRARWLAVATKDRYLMSIGQPQWYGTQYRKRDGHWTLYDVDPSITDEQRMSWNAPPLDVARRRAEQLDGM
jgi:hypothetical protein